MAQAPTIDLAAAGGLGATERRDGWWIGPVATGLGLGGFIIYATFRACYNADYRLGAGTGVLQGHAYLLSPLYSPLIVLPESLAWISPAFFILWAPGGFRVTCYYYRKAYYRAFFLDPVGCAVGGSAVSTAAFSFGASATSSAIRVNWSVNVARC